MPICQNCGVELKKGTISCPLCGLNLNGSKQEKVIMTESPPHQDKKKINNHFHWIWELFTFLMATGLIVVFMVDFAFGMSIGWSKIPLISITYVWLSVTLGFKIKRKIYLLLLIEFLVLMIFLWLLDSFISGKSWFYDFVLPFLLFTGVILEITLAVIYKFKLQTLAVVALSFFSLGVFLVCLEAVLSNFLLGIFVLRWSLVAFGCLIPISGFILYVKHKIKKRGRDLEKYFHA